MQSSKTILVVAGDHRGNLGDKGIVTATVDLLRNALGNPKVFLAGGGSPGYWAPLGVEPIREGLLGFGKVLRVARRSDLVICGGGGLFQDDDSRVKMPYWAAKIGAIRPFARRMVGYSIGAGPLKHAFSRDCATWIVHRLDSISVRDELAREVLEPLSDKSVAVVPDPALLLGPAPGSAVESLLENHGVPQDGRPLIGVAPRQWFHLRSQLIPHKYAARYRLRPIPGEAQCRRFVDLLAEVLDRLVEKHGAHVVFLPTYNVAHEGDDAIAERIAKQMRNDAHSVLRIDDPRLYKRATERLSVLLAARMHPTIFAASMGTPVIGLAYNQKFRGFLQSIAPGAEPLGIDEFVAQEAVPTVLASIEAVLGRRDLYRDRIAALQASILEYTNGLLIANGLLAPDGPKDRCDALAVQ